MGRTAASMAGSGAELRTDLDLEVSRSSQGADAEAPCGHGSGGLGRASPSVLSGRVTADSDEVAQEMLAAMMTTHEAAPEATPREEEEEALGDLKDRVRLAMYSKLEDGSLEKAVQSAADAAGAQHFSDMPPSPPPDDLCESDPGDLAIIDADGKLVPERSAPRQPTPQDLAALRRRTAELLAQAADSGGLERILIEVKKEMFVEVRQRVAGLLTEAADNGNLEKILEDVKGNPEAGNPQAQVVKEDVRQKAASLLTEAANSGLLEQVLAQRVPEDAKDLDQAKAKAARLLSQAANDGTLEKVLVEVHAATGDDLAQIRGETAALMLEASRTGELGRVVTELRGEKAAEAPRRIAGTGTKSQLEEDTLQEIRAAAKASLLEAAETGALERIVSELQETRAPLQMTKVKVRAQLQEAAQDGRLEAALTAVNGTRAAATAPAPAAPVPAFDAPEADVEKVGDDVRRRIEQQLLEALEDGRLEEAVKSETVNLVSVEEFSAKMFLEAFAEKGRRLKTLLQSITEAEAQIKLREQRCQQLQAHVSQNKLELAHLDLDSEWCSKLLESAEERRKALQQAQRRLMGTIHTLSKRELEAPRAPAGALALA